MKHWGETEGDEGIKVTTEIVTERRRKKERRREAGAEEEEERGSEENQRSWIVPAERRSLHASSPGELRLAAGQRPSLRSYTALDKITETQISILNHETKISLIL